MWHRFLAKGSPTVHEKAKVYCNAANLVNPRPAGAFRLELNLVPGVYSSPIDNGLKYPILVKGRH